MKYAFVTFSCPELSFPEVLKLANKFGYDGVEIRTQCEQRHRVEIEASALERKEFKVKAENAGITICSISTTCMYSNPETCQENVKLTHESIDLAGDLGCERVRVFGGTIPTGVTREESTKCLSHALASVADHAADRGVTICIETHDDWSDPNFYADILTRLDHPALAVTWDIMHPVRYTGCCMRYAYKILKPWIKHVHVHDGIFGDDYVVELVAIGQGDVDHREAIEILQQADYDGFISGEWINWEPGEIHLPRELATLKSYEVG